MKEIESSSGKFNIEFVLLLDGSVLDSFAIDAWEESSVRDFLAFFDTASVISGFEH